MMFIRKVIFIKMNMNMINLKFHANTSTTIALPSKKDLALFYLCSLISWAASNRETNSQNLSTLRSAPISTLTLSLIYPSSYFSVEGGHLAKFCTQL